jgi:nitrous oxidase accessory protein NosD
VIYVWDVWGDARVVISGNWVMSNVAGTSDSGDGGGLYIGNADGVEVIDNIVLSNTGCYTNGHAYGGGVFLSSSDGAILSGNRIEHNVGQRGVGPSGSYGGGVSLWNSADVVFSRNVLRHNIASAVMADGNGGGLYVTGIDRMRVDQNTFEGNRGAPTPHGAGGAIYAIDATDLQLEANWLLRNSAAQGGALTVRSGTIFTMTNNILAENAGWASGGALEVRPGSTRPATGTLLHNSFRPTTTAATRGRAPSGLGMQAWCSPTT